jgi:hypothetical protein
VGFLGDAGPETTGKNDSFHAFVASIACGVDCVYGFIAWGLDGLPPFHLQDRLGDGRAPTLKLRGLTSEVLVLVQEWSEAMTCKSVIFYHV